jgi:hypothetical protein
MDRVLVYRYLGGAADRAEMRGDHEESDAILCAMDLIFYSLTEAEREGLNLPGSGDGPGPGSGSGSGYGGG